MDKTITEKELIDKAADEVVRRYEARKKEEQEKADAEAKVKAEADAKAKAETEKSEQKQEFDMEKLIDATVARIQKIEGAKSDKNASVDIPNDQFGAAVIPGRRKMTKDDKDLVDAVNSKSNQTLSFKFDMYECEDRLRWGFKKYGEDGIKASMDGASSYGADILPETFSGDLYMRLFSMHGNLASYVRKVPMTAYKHNLAELIPGITVSAYSSYQNQNLAVENVTASSPTTAEAELTAKKFVAATNVYNDLLADVKVNLMTGIRRYLALEFAKSLSNSLLNGDTTATHMDEDYAAASANIPEKMWMGWRRMIMDGSLGVDGTDAAFTLANLISVKSLLKKWAKGPQKNYCKWLFGDYGLDKLVSLLLAQTAAPQMADYTIKEGEVQKLLGIEVLYTDVQREDLETDGYADSTGTDGNQGFIALVNMNEFVLGVRQEVEIKIVADDLKDRKVFQATMRGDFVPFETPTTTISTCAGLYGYTN